MIRYARLCSSVRQTDSGPLLCVDLSLGFLTVATGDSALLASILRPSALCAPACDLASCCRSRPIPRQRWVGLAARTSPQASAEHLDVQMTNMDEPCLCQVGVLRRAEKLIQSRACTRAWIAAGECMRRRIRVLVQPLESEFKWLAGLRAARTQCGGGRTSCASTIGCSTSQWASVVCMRESFWRRNHSFACSLCICKTDGGERRVSATANATMC